MGQNFKWKAFRFAGVGILLALFAFAQTPGRNLTGSSREDAAVQEEHAEDEDLYEYFLPEGYTEMPEMCVETDSGAVVTGAVLAHDGKYYALTEKEYLFMQSNSDDALISELLAKRKGSRGK